MPNATRFALLFRLAGRPLPTLLLAAQGLTMLPAVGQDAATDPPAAVLRVARDQPRLDTPRSATHRRETESSRRKTRAPMINGPTLNSPVLSAPANASESTRVSGLAASGASHEVGSDSAAETGWVSRGAIRQKPSAAAQQPEATIAARPEEDPAGTGSSTVRGPLNLNATRATSNSEQDAASLEIVLPEIISPEITSPEIAAREVAQPKLVSPNDSSSNSRSLALQEQIERYEAVELEQANDSGAADDSGADEPRFVEIIPESIETTPIDAPPIDEILVAEEPAIDTDTFEAAPPEMEIEPREIEPQASQSRRTRQRAADQLPKRQPTIERMPLRDPSIPGLASRDAVEFEEDQPVEAAPVDRQRVAPAPVISAAALRLKQPIEHCLQYYHQRPENSRERTPWGMLHAILPYGLDANIDAGNRRFNAIAWLAGNNPCRDLKMLTLSPSGRIEARTGIGLQGHQAQLLAILAQVGVPEDYPLYVGPRRYTVADLVESEMAACRAGEELTFTLIGLSHYLPTDTSWTASDGQPWDFEKLIREELQQPVVGAACGGTHRLMGLSYALAQRRAEGASVTGQWERAAIFIDDFVAYAWQLQNRDGSLSSQWFEGREDNGDVDRKVQTTGHILEWLVFNATDEQLQDERFVQGITFLANSMIANRGSEWQVGPKGHALRALSLYHRRVFDSQRPWRSNRTAAAKSGDRR